MLPSSSRYNYCARALRETQFFSSLTQEVFHEILAIFQYDSASKRDTRIVLDGEQQRFSILITGRVKVSVYHPETGREHVLSLLGPGDGFDIVSLLDGMPRDVVATALDDVEFLSAPLEQVRKWLLEHPDFNKTFLPYLGAQMRQLAEQVEDLSLHDTEVRLARLILRHLTSNTPMHGLKLINDLSQETLAAMIGSVRVVVSQHFQLWKDQGVLTGGRGKWEVKELQALLAKAERKYPISSK